MKRYCNKRPAGKRTTERLLLFKPTFDGVLINLLYAENVADKCFNSKDEEDPDCLMVEDSASCVICASLSEFTEAQLSSKLQSICFQTFTPQQYEKLLAFFLRFGHKLRADPRSLDHVPEIEHSSSSSSPTFLKYANVTHIPGEMFSWARDEGVELTWSSFELFVGFQNKQH